MAEWETIPGETPIPDISGLRLKGVMTRGQLNVAEAENIRHALIKYLSAKPSRRLAPFDVRWMLRLHGDMFGRVWKWAGQLRQTDLNIGPAASGVEAALHLLAGDVDYWRQHGGIPLIEQAAMIHHRAVAIHPFLNGNGRWARLLANIYLRQNDAPLILWPEETVGAASVIRQEYLAAIRAADAGDSAPLIKLHERYAREN